MFDLIIIGASAAGMSAAIYASRSGLKFLVVSENIGGNAAKVGLMENYMGFGSISGLELAKKFEEHFESNNPEVVLGKVSELIKKGDGFLVKINDKEYETKTVIVASGTRHKKLEISGEREFSNKGVSYCETCDGPIFKGKNVAVIGGGNSALKASLSLSLIAKKVCILTIGEAMKGEKTHIDKVKSLGNIEIIHQVKTLEFFGENLLKGVRYKDLVSGEKKEIEVEGAFIYVGLTANTSFIDKNLGILDEKGEVVTDKFGKTQVPGLFAAGDVTDLPYRQISIASGAGTIALLSALDYLTEK
jgi:thioredoxin-disulfide reductase